MNRNKKVSIGLKLFAYSVVYILVILAVSLLLMDLPANHSSWVKIGVPILNLVYWVLPALSLIISFLGLLEIQKTRERGTWVAVSVMSADVICITGLLLLDLVYGG